MTIPELLQKRATAWAAAQAAHSKGMDGGGMTAELTQEYDTHMGTVAGCDDLLQKAKDLEARKAASAVDLKDPGTHVDKDADDKMEPGVAIVRTLACFIARKSTQERIAFAEERGYGARIIKALTAGSTTGGGFTIAGEMSNQLIELLRPASIVRALGAVNVPMPTGSLTYPKLTGGATASYIGEGDNAPKTQQTFGQLILTRKKLAALVPISNDLIRYSAIGVEAVVKEDLINALAQAEDLAFIRGLGTGGSPRGLRYWAPTANVLTVNASVNLANVTTDLGRLALTLEEANTRMLRPGWMMAPRTKQYLMDVRDGNGNYAFRTEMLAGRLNGYPYRVTTQIPKNLAVTGTSESELYLADFADVVIGDVPGFNIIVSTEAAYDDGTGTLRSALQRDETVIQLIAEHDIGMRHDGSVAVFSDVDWGV